MYIQRHKRKRSEYK